MLQYFFYGIKVKMQKENLKTGLAATTSIISMIISYFYLIFSAKTFLIIVFIKTLLTGALSFGAALVLKLWLKNTGIISF